MSNQNHSCWVELGVGNVGSAALLSASLALFALARERDSFQALVKALSRMDEQDKKLLLSMAQGMARGGAENVS